MGKMRVVLGAIFVCLAAGATEAEPTYRVGFRGHPGIQWHEPNGHAPGRECFGNCGAACTDSPNPLCGGPQQYWIQEMLSDPQYTGMTTSYSECMSGGTLLVHTLEVHAALMRETYHGFSTLGCRMHDDTCGSSHWDPGCWWMPASTCAYEREEKEWSFTTWGQGTLLVNTEEIRCGCAEGPYICY